MNKQKAITALSICALLLMGGCQKETETTDFRNGQQSTAVVGDAISIHYRIGGKLMQTSFNSEEELKAFLHYLNGLAKEGENISVGLNGQRQTPASKEVITFYSENEEEMAEWMYYMILEGFTVQVVYDEDKGVFIGTATRP